MTEAEWYALGNPPGSFDDLLRMARENSVRLHLGAFRPHPWDEWLTTRRDSTTYLASADVQRERRSGDSA